LSFIPHIHFKVNFFFSKYYNCCNFRISKLFSLSTSLNGNSGSYTNSDDTGTCCICLDDFPVVRLHANHFVCVDCAIELCRYCRPCPLCRHPLFAPNSASQSLNRTSISLNNPTSYDIIRLINNRGIIEIITRVGGVPILSLNETICRSYYSDACPQIDVYYGCEDYFSTLGLVVENFLASSSLNGNNGSWTNSDDTLADVSLAGNNRLNNPNMFRNKVQRNIRQGGGRGDTGIATDPIIIPTAPHFIPQLHVPNSPPIPVTNQIPQLSSPQVSSNDSSRSPLLPDPDSPDYITGLETVNLYYKMSTPFVVSLLGCSKHYLSTNISKTCLFLYKYLSYFVFIFSAIFLVVSTIMSINGSPNSAVEVIFAIDTWPVIAKIIRDYSASTSGIPSLIILYSIIFLLNFVYLFLEFFKFLIFHSFHSPTFLCLLLYSHWLAVDKFLSVLDRIITDAIIRFSISEHDEESAVDKYPHMEIPDMDRLEFRSLFLLEDSRLLGGLRINLLWNLAYTHYRTCQIDRNLLKYLSNYRGSKITEHLYRNCHYELRKVADRNVVNNTIVYFINQEEFTQSTLNFLKLSPTSVPVY
jgi:hypothetical protein